MKWLTSVCEQLKVCLQWESVDTSHYVGGPTSFDVGRRRRREDSTGIPPPTRGAIRAGPFPTVRGLADQVQRPWRQPTYTPTDVRQTLSVPLSRCQVRAATANSDTVGPKS